MVEYVTFYSTWQEYIKNMRIRIWDFTVRYLMKPLRLDEKEMQGFDKFVSEFVAPYTHFHALRGKVMVWSVASMYFYGQLKLSKRMPFEITLNKLAEVFDISCPIRMLDFKKVIDYIKLAHLEQNSKETADIYHTIYEACKILQA